MTLTRDQILGLDDLRRVEVQTPEWGGSVFVRMMTGAERAQWEIECDGMGRATARERLVIATVCDEAGKSLFTREDLPALKAKSGVPLERIALAALRLNKIRKADIEELEKNSESPAPGSSPST